MTEKKEKLWNLIQEDGLVGPWYWSDLLSHVAHIIAYGVLRQDDIKPESYKSTIMAIFSYVESCVLWILDSEEWLVNFPEPESEPDNVR